MLRREFVSALSLSPLIGLPTETMTSSCVLGIATASPVPIYAVMSEYAARSIPFVVIMDDDRTQPTLQSFDMNRRPDAIAMLDFLHSTHVVLLPWVASASWCRLYDAVKATWHPETRDILHELDRSWQCLPVDPEPQGMNWWYQQICFAHSSYQRLLNG